MDTLFPAVITGYLELFAPAFPAKNFLYFRGFVMAMMLLGQSRKCVTNVSRVCFFLNRHISSWERFLSQSQWDMGQIQRQLISLIREQMGEKLLVHGAYLGWLDTTLIPKGKGKMPGVQKWHDHSGNPDRGAHLVGHHWALVGLTGAMVLAGKWTPVCWPLLANLIPGQTNPFGFVVSPEGVAQAMTFWDAVCPLIAHLHQLLEKQPLRVVADAYFCKASFINWMLSLQVHVITRMRKDAVGWDDPEPEPPRPDGKKKRGPKPTKPQKGKKWKIASLLKAFPRQSVSVETYGQRRTLQVVTRELWIKDVLLQKVRVVVVETLAEPLILLSTDLTLSAQQIIEIYAMRFPLELAIRDLKQHFGLGHYQCTGFLAMGRFVGLALVSFCLWRLVALSNLNAAWLQDHDQTSILSFTRVSRAVRRFVVQRIFQTSASEADFRDSGAVPQEVLRLIA